MDLRPNLKACEGHPLAQKMDIESPIEERPCRRLQADNTIGADARELQLHNVDNRALDLDVGGLDNMSSLGHCVDNAEEPQFLARGARRERDAEVIVFGRDSGLAKSVLEQGQSAHVHRRLV